MALEQSSYSPNILIYLEIGEKKIRLSDVLYDTATLFERVEIPADTNASLVFTIDGSEEREDVILKNGISIDESVVSFSYADPTKVNGRHFPSSRITNGCS